MSSAAVRPRFAWCVWFRAIRLRQARRSVVSSFIWSTSCRGRRPCSANHRTRVVVVPAGIGTADVGVVVRAVVVVLAVRAVAVALAARAVAGVLVVRAARAEAEARRVPMVQSLPGTVRPGTKAVRRRVADLVGRCRVPQTSAPMPRMPMPRATLALLAIRASTSAVLGRHREIVPRAAQGPKVLLVGRHKATADATTAVPTVVRVPRTPPVVLVAAVRATAAVDLDLDLDLVRVRARAGRKAADRSRRAAIAIGAVLVEVAGTSLPSRRRSRIRQLP